MGMSCTCNELYGYKIIKENIGKCSNGEIHKVSKDGKYFAMKKMNYKEEEEINRIENEINILKSFDHYNIVEYINSFIINDYKYIIMEFCESDLNKFINDKKKNNELIDEKVIYIILKDICYGLKEIHSKNIIHRDLKPSNILIGSDKKLKIADFGISKYNNQQLTHNMCTQDYAAPEFIDDKKEYDKRIDLWSLGCIMSDLCSSEFPSICNFYNAKSIINRNYNQNLQKLINLLLVEAKDRIDLHKIISIINNLEPKYKIQNEKLDQLSRDILKRKEENEIKLDLEIGKDDIKKEIYFLDNDEAHGNLKELNENNTELYIYINKETKIFQTFEKKYIFKLKGNYKILLKLKNKLSDSSYMFYKCSNLKYIDLTFFDTTNITIMSNMFAYNKLKTIDLSSFKTIKVKNMNYMFFGTNRFIIFRYFKCGRYELYVQKL